CWITGSSSARDRAGRPYLSSSLGPLHDLDHPPTLGGRQRPGLHEDHPVADAALVVLVVRLQLAGAAHDLAVQRVLDPVLDLDHHGLVHLVADHDALADLAAAPWPAAVVLGRALGHDPSFPTSSSPAASSARPSADACGASPLCCSRYS